MCGLQQLHVARCWLEGQGKGEQGVTATKVPGGFVLAADIRMCKAHAALQLRTLYEGSGSAIVPPLVLLQYAERGR